MRAAILTCLLPIVWPIHAKAPIKDALFSVSFVRVLAHPEKFNGKRVEIMGFYQSSFERSALFLSESDARISYYEQSLWIGEPKDPDSKLEYPEQGWVRVIGRFRYREHDNEPAGGSGHMGLWFAEIYNVEVLASVEPKTK